MKNRSIALNTNTYHAFSLDAAIAEAVYSGIPTLELSAVRGWTEHIGIDFPRSEILEIRKKIADAGLIIPVMSAHSDLRNRLPDFLRSIELAKECGCRTIVTSSGEAHPNEEEGSEDKLLEALKIAYEACQNVGLQLAMETHGAYGSGEKLAGLFDRLGLPLGIAYDTANVIRHGKVFPQDDLPKCVDRVIHVHLKDRAGMPMDRIFPALGHGWIDFNFIFKTLDEAQYAGSYSVEIEYFEENPPCLERVNRDVRASWSYLREIGRA